VTEWNDIGEACVCFNIRKAARTLTQFYEGVLRPSGLRVGQFSVLVALKVRGPVTLGDLAATTVTDRTTLTRNLKPLERQGFLKIEIGEDPRSRRVSLTEAGLDALSDALPLWDHAQAQIAARIGEEAMGDLLSRLTTVVGVIRRT
jgi:DNA-binding MarR family transcriptional regulator